MDYTLRHSKKAKHVQLRMSHKGLEVVIPEKKRISIKSIHDFVMQKQHWIEQVKQRLSLQETHCKIELPKTINLRAINQQVDVVYHFKETKTTLYQETETRLVMVGQVDNMAVCLPLLKKWLRKIAQEWLPQMLLTISKEVGLPFNGVTIRNNIRRWGSCNSQQNISLSCRLLFLPEHLVRHIMLHELSHTEHMNHGASFKKLLRKLDENTQQHISELRKFVIPAWV